ncbi:MAG: hypothetical protein M3Z17_09980 [Gemmatimonadota bacterium]|nr:hypothetical protein [Gemmatimonadota bacterium]
MKARIVAVAFSASLLCSAQSFAQVATPAPQNRPLLEQQLRARVAEITRKRLQLDDTQMTKLEAVNARFAPQLGAVAAQERDTRQKLRAQLTAANADESAVSGLLDELLRLQRQRLTLLESEQKDLSGFLTPVQRAKYMGLQAQIKRRVEQLRRNAPGAAGARAGKPPLR